MRLVSQCLLMTFMMLIPASVTLQGKNAPPIPAEKLVGVWEGFDEYGLSFTRLELRADFSGYVSETGGPQGVYRIQNWQYDGHHFAMDLVPISNHTESTVHVTANNGSLVMNLFFHGKGWPHEVRLFPESRFEVSSRQTQQAIEAATR